jgi:Spy/CpxP family protein refolding chaperone
MKRTITVVALLAATLGVPLHAQAPQGPPGPPQDPFSRLLFPPELVMQHQGEINLQDSQRAALQTAIQQAQSKFVDVQWRLSAEGEKLARLLQGPVADEAQVLEQVDRILAAEREVKRTQIGLLVRIKNTLTPVQQAKLAKLAELADPRGPGRP